MIAVLLIPIFFLLTVVFLVGLLPPRSFRRIKTAREDALHNQIQQAMNWSPEMFYKGEDGVYRNSRGEVGEVMTLKEFIAKYEKKNPNE